MTKWLYCEETGQAACFAEAFADSLVEDEICELVRPNLLVFRKGVTLFDFLLFTRKTTIATEIPSTPSPKEETLHDRFDSIENHLAYLESLLLNRNDPQI